MAQDGRSGLAQYQYSLIGGGMLLLAAVAVGVAYAVPWGSLDMDIEGDDMLVEYGITHLDVTIGEGEDRFEDTVSYRDDEAEGPGVKEFQTGFWLTPIAGVLMFAAALAMFAVPSSSLAAARGGAVAGLLGGAVLIAAITAFGLGFVDHREQVERDLDETEFAYEGSTSIRAGGVFLGAGVILGLGGAMLGFSDKATPGPAPRRRKCPDCDASVPGTQAFCGSCGASVAS